MAHAQSREKLPTPMTRSATARPTGQRRTTTDLTASRQGAPCASDAAVVSDNRAQAPAHVQACRAPIDRTPCALCADLHSVDRDFLHALAAHRGSWNAAVESVVDCVGFCEHHGRLVAQTTHMGTVGVILAAVDALDRLMSDETRNAERLEHLASAAERSCPGCRYRDHQLARAVHAHANQAATTPWCFPHYHDIAYAVQSEVLPALTRMELHRLQAIAYEVSEWSLQSRLAAAPDMAAVNTALAFDIAMIAGAAYTASSMRSDCSSASPERFHAQPCSVCKAVDHAEVRWLESVRTAARLKHDVWIVFPTCPTHIRRCTEMNDLEVSASIAEYAASVQTGVLQSGVEWLARDNAARETAKQSVWYRRQSPAYILGQQRRSITRLPRCPACERLIVGRDGAITNLLTALRGRARDALERVENLCLKHYAATYLLLPPGQLRSETARIQVGRLRSMRKRVGQPDGASTDTEESDGLAKAAWRDLVAYLSSCA
jgi:hypothetical protein